MSALAGDAPGVVRELDLSNLAAGLSYAALGIGAGDMELVTLWPSHDPDHWWVCGFARAGFSKWTRVPVRRADIATVLQIMRVDASKLRWNATPCDPLDENPYAKDGHLPARREPAPVPAVKEWVYFIRAGTSGPIKIGKAQNVRVRLSTLQTSTAVPLHVLGIVAGGRDRERELHEQFAHLRLRGEWFVPEPELLQFITQEASQWQP